MRQVLLDKPRRYDPVANMTKAIMARAVAERDGGDASEIAAQRWGAQTAELVRAMHRQGIQAADVTKAAVGPSASGLAEYEYSTFEFFEAVSNQAVISRLPGRGDVPLHTKVLASDGGGNAEWTATGKAVGVTAIDLTGVNLPPLQVTATAILTRELLESSDPSAERVVRADLSRAVVKALDTAFLAPGNAGVAGERPASITFGVSPIAATGTAKTDLKALTDNFAGDLTVASFIASPRTFAGLSSSNHPDCGVRGGSLLGAPALASRHVEAFGSPPVYPLILVDGSGIAVAEGPVSFSFSAEGSILQDSAPNMSVSPPVPATTQVSLWQTGCVAVSVSKVINWKVARAGSASFLTGVDY